LAIIVSNSGDDEEYEDMKRVDLMKVSVIATNEEKFMIM